MSLQKTDSSDHQQKVIHRECGAVQTDRFTLVKRESSGRLNIFSYKFQFILFRCLFV